MSVEARRNSIWSNTRLETPPFPGWNIRLDFYAKDESVRQAALHSMSLWRDRDSLPGMITLLKSDSAHNRRGAAAGLGIIGDKSAIPALLGAFGEKADRFLEHALIFALIEIGDREATADGSP